MPDTEPWHTDRSKTFTPVVKAAMVKTTNRTHRHTDSCFIEEQLETCGQLYGYRWMHSKCLQHAFVVSQKTVRLLLSILDPEGVAARRRHRLVRRKYRTNGPNEVWYMDGYDTIKALWDCYQWLYRWLF